MKIVSVTSSDFIGQADTVVVATEDSGASRATETGASVTGLDYFEPRKGLTDSDAIYRTSCVWVSTHLPNLAYHNFTPFFRNLNNDEGPHVEIWDYFVRSSSVVPTGPSSYAGRNGKGQLDRSLIGDVVR